MSKLSFNRRSILKGMLGGASVTIGLPLFEAMLNSNGTALASGGALPKRFGIFFWGNGMIPDRWNPIGEGEGDDWQLSEQLMPLQNIKSEITVVSGTSVLTGNSIPHGSGPAGIFSGAPLLVRSSDDWSYQAPSLDQRIAQEIGGETRFKSIEFGARAERGLSFNGPDNRNPPEDSPKALFDRIFGGGFVAPGEEGMVDPKLRLRRSVLDAVIGDANKLKDKLGSHDKARLDQHLTGLRELEQRIARLEEDPPMLDAYMRPAEPDADYPDIEGRPQISAINRALCDTMVMALACDQTRVFSNWLTYPVSNNLFPESPAGHHRLTHDEPGDQPEVNKIVIQIIEELAYMLNAMRAVPEGQSTLLDNCCVLATSDTSFGRTHSLDDYPIIIGGTACGALKKGLHYRSSTGENSSRVILSILRAMDVLAADFGIDAGRTDTGLSAIEA